MRLGTMGPVCPLTSGMPSCPGAFVQLYPV
jgi:hypothetical protein